MSEFHDRQSARTSLRVLTLDGGGAKGFYTLGVLKEIEAMAGCPLHQSFDLVFGTSTGAIIASLIALGYGADAILDLYRKHVPAVMSQTTAYARSAALKKLAGEVFGDSMFGDVKTGIGIVTARWLTERPMIFKGSVAQAHGRVGTFVPGFGVSIADAVTASCSAYPFFERTIVRTSLGEDIELIDGGYCANNPTLYALADAVRALNCERRDIRLVSIGVGIYPEPKPRLLMRFAKKYLVSVHLLQKTLEINTQSMDQLRQVLFHDVPTVRINESYVSSEMATDLLEHDLKKLDILFQRGRESFALHEEQLRQYLT
ncbi:patatin-like phospholipase family protein [Castellaniella sp.]|uniref:patatin-like phospholipase family protein n=1 Tax=Castellaniella sp. TaxID=1955812 RepID=UPI003A8EC22E